MPTQDPFPESTRGTAALAEVGSFLVPPAPAGPTPKPEDAEVLGDPKVDPRQHCPPFPPHTP